MAFQALHAKIDGLEGPAGIRTSLHAKLNTADRLFQRGLPCPSAQVVGAFVNQNWAQKGRQIPVVIGSTFINQAGDLILMILVETSDCHLGSDGDQDQMEDVAEQALRTDPGQRDTDHDQADDGLELLEIDTDPLLPDTDGDQCDDGDEIGPNADRGGQRDPRNVWDFMDQYAGSQMERNGTISIGDVGALVKRFGASGDPSGNPLIPPVAQTGYHTSADRNGSYPGQDPWDLMPPDGQIAVGDIGAVVVQFGHRCL